MMDVRNIKGDLLVSVPITSDAVIHEELMTSDYIALSWNSDSGDSLPVGTFVEYDGERYSLLEPYAPTMTNENEYRYSPQFHSRIAVWDKQPACVYTYENDGVTVKSREFDWSFVGSPADAMQIVKQAIKNETGETWTVMVSDSLPASIEISGQASSIKSVLASIADLCQTEYWADKKNNVLHLSKCERGSAVALKVGVNVGVPSVMTRGAEYYTRYYALGSTRNIAQSASNVNGSVNKRLTLDTDVYPNGYKDIKGHFENGVFVSDLEQGEVYSKVVVFEDIYPSSNLEIESVRPRMKYRLDGDGKKIKVGGTDDDPIYDQYAIWYFKIKSFSFSEDLLIKGLPLSVHFKSGRLTGQEFELIYHENAKKENTEGDVVPFEVEAGSYEIKFKESSGTIIPDIAYIVPQDGDKITLFNIEMPSEYTKDAQNRLLEALEKEIAKDHADGNTYEVESNPVAFYESSLTVSLGQKVTFTSGDKTLSTRALMVERCLDGEYRQKIRVGSDIIKGSTKELRENVANLNQNVDVLAAFNDLSKSIQDAYGRNQAIVNEAIALINSVWRLEGDNLVTDKQVVVKNNLMAEKEISAGGAPTEEGESSGLGFDDLQWYLDQNKYVKEEDIAQLIPDNIATKDDVEERIAEVIAGAPEALDTLKEIADALAHNQDEIGAIFDVISEKASKEELKAVDDKHSASIAAINTKDNEQDQAIAGLVAKDASIESSITEIKGKDEEQDRELDSIEGRLAEAEKITALFGKDEDGNVYVKNSKNFYTLGEISAGGAGTAGGGGGGSDVGGGYLDSLYDVELNEIAIDANLSAAEKEAVTESQVLGYDSKGLWVNKKTMYIHHQTTNSAKWTITHGLNKMPNVKIVDSSGELVYGSVKYSGMNEVEISFGHEFAGKAYLD